MRSIGNCSTSTLQAIASGRAFDEPVYSFADYARTAETRRIEPTEFLIVEGLFVLYWPELRAMLDTKVYVQTDPDVCFHRRLTRDVAERGRTPESVREQYERTVRPERGVVRLPHGEIRRPGGLRRRAVRALHQVRDRRPASRQSRQRLISSAA